MKLTVDFLTRAVGCSAENAGAYLRYLERYLDLYQIAEPNNLFAFLAQSAHESMLFAVTEERLNYSVGALLSQFGRHRISAEDAAKYGRSSDHPANQETIANLIYGGIWGARHLGNVNPGDGWKYRGRGLIQITGASNYRALTRSLQAKVPGAPDFLESPDKLKEPEWATAGSIDWWVRHRCHILAEQGEFLKISKTINLGDPDASGVPNGNEEREALWLRVKQASQYLTQDESETESQATAPNVEPAEEVEEPLAQSSTNQEKPMLPLIQVLAASLIEGFSPLIKEKVTAELNRHTDTPGVADKIYEGLVNSAKIVTKQEDPIQAVAMVKSDPSLNQKVEQQVEVKLQELLPLFDKMMEMEQKSWERVEASRSAAAARAAAEPGCGRRQDQYLTKSVVRMMVGVLFGLGVLAIWLRYLGQDVGGIIGTLLTLVGVVAMTFRTRYEYEYGSSDGSKSKDASQEAMLTTISKLQVTNRKVE